MDLSSYKVPFLVAARAHLADFSEKVSNLSSNPGDSESINEAHRAIHSLGSQFFAMGYKSTGEYVRIIENYFYHIKEEADFNPEVAPTINEALNSISNSLSKIEESNMEVDFEIKLSELSEKLK